MRVMITGGAGYLGTQLAIQLDKNPRVEEIIIFDNLSRNNFNLFLHSRIKHGKMNFIKGELLDSKRLKNIIKYVDVVYHLADTDSNKEKDHHLHEQVNNWGTAELVYAAEESNVKQFIYLSSSSVYGYSDEEIKINTTPNPETSAGHSKLRGEKHVERLSDKINTQIIRCGKLYGYGTSMNMDSALNKIIFDSCFSKRISIHGNGYQKRPFIHIDKAVNILENLLTTPLESGIYNMSDHNLSIMELVEHIQQIVPDLEMIFTSHHLELPSRTVAPDKRILQLYNGPELDLEKDLKLFKEKFYRAGE